MLTVVIIYHVLTICFYNNKKTFNCSLNANIDWIMDEWMDGWMNDWMVGWMFFFVAKLVSMII